MEGKMPKVLISDDLSPRATEIFEERGIEVDRKIGMKPEELLACVGAYDGLAIRSATKATREVLATATNLKVIGRAGIGVDNVDVDAATEAGVVVMNTPFGNAVTTAEHAIAMICALARQIPMANESTQAGKWEKSRFMGSEITGKRLGLIGCGNIGSIVADRARGLKMRVLAYDPYLSEERAVDLGIRKVDLDTLLAEADFISLHTPLTDATRDIIDAEALAKTKKGVRIVNCARGGLVVEEALREALESGHVAGAGVDVFSSEPAKENVLFGAPGLIATPHLGAATMEAQEKVALQVAEQMADYLLTGAITNAVNMPSVTAEEAPVLRPYMKLAELLGSFAGQVAEEPVKVVRIEFEGLATAINAAPVVSAALAGLMKPSMDAVNMVSAPKIAQSRGIAVSTVRHDRPCDYQTLLRLTVEGEKRTRVLAGTLFAGDRPRLIDIQGIKVEAEFAPTMLYVRNYDRPGFIGGLGTVTGNAGLNIATFHLGRRDDSGEALALVEVDGEISEDLLAKVRELPQVVRVNALKF
jgi:D-3-phosphoglycerate dehydrogenase